MQNATTGSGFPHSDGPNPYAEGALAYFRHGWTDVFPTGTPSGPRYAKSPIPKGVTGYEGEPVGFQKIQATVHSPAGRRNLAVRMPRHIVCLDVDGYGDKSGVATLAAMESALGPLPATYRNSARGIGSPSGHRYFRLPADKVIRPAAEEDIGRKYGPNIEILHHYRRYAVAWPSLNPDHGLAPYLWYAPDGQAMDGPPRVVDVPLLPDAWLPLFATEPGAPDSRASGGNLRAVRPVDETGDDIFDDAPVPIRRSRAEMYTMEQIRAVLTMTDGTVNKVLGGAGIWLARMSACGLLSLAEAREVLGRAARRNGVHSDEWNRRNRRRWTLDSRIADALSQGLNRQRYLLIDDHPPIDMHAAILKEIAR